MYFCNSPIGELYEPSDKDQHFAFHNILICLRV